MKNKKLRVGVLFGGRSGEHEVSLVSAKSIIKAFDRNKYEVVPIGIDKGGKWLMGPDVFNLLSGNPIHYGQGKEAKKIYETVLSPVPNNGRLLCLQEGGKKIRKQIDVIFPVLHGTFGEDGAVQGLLELAEIPYVGCGVLASAVGMDKSIQKQVLRDAGLPVTPWLEVRKNEFELSRASFYEKVASLGMPVFVKPANMGSSIGVHKVKDGSGLQEAIDDAFLYDHKVLIEKAVPSAREIECAVLGGAEPRASVLGEIISSGDFYDYASKYIDGKSKAEIPADLPNELADKIKKMAIRCFKVLSCSGLARVDFLLDGARHAPFVNEINTLPGFTDISMYPQLWKASGLPQSALVDELIGLALKNHEEKKSLRRTFPSHGNWWNKPVKKANEIP